jgi:hypothetical protein
MKTNFLTTIILLFTFVSFAQSQTSEHLSFKGVPIDGTLNQYVAKMKQNGFVHLTTENSTAVLSGDFAGYKDCTVGVSTLNQKNLVYKIVVVFPDKETWSTLSGNYFDLKQMLTEKYGEPSEVVENFGNDHYSNSKDDNSKIYDVKFDRYKYYSIYETGKGTIQLSIEHDNVSNCYVKLAYFDKTNNNIIKSKAKDDL